MNGNVPKLVFKGASISKKHVMRAIEASSTSAVRYEIDTKPCLSVSVLIRLEQASNIDSIAMYGVRGGVTVLLDAFPQPGANVDYDFHEIMSKSDKLIAEFRPKAGATMSFKGIMLSTLVLVV